jgi:methyltransferase (TIGR00027 family)
MKAHQPSRTAEHNALFRAMESVRARQERIVDDWMAEQFLGIPFRLVARLSRNSACAMLLCHYIDYRWPGSRTSLIARTRLIDDYLVYALANGIQRVVILGAGFDSRAYRITGAKSALFFEVDHPNTSEVKKAHIRGVFGRLPEHVKYVPVNFQRDSIREALEASGFTPYTRSLFVWEGVSNYLTEGSVRNTLEFIGGLVEGTALIFTYVDEAVLRNPKQFAGGDEVQRTFARLEEPWTFGLHPDHVSEFFQQCGLCLDSDLSAAEYRKRYYKAAIQIKGYEFYDVVTAHVPKNTFSAEYSIELLHA